MENSPSRLLSSVATIALIAGAFVAVPHLREAVAAEPLLSAAQLEKIKAWIAQGGSDIGVNKVETDILGLTKNDETISTRALAVKDPQAGDIHLFGTLPNDKGYVEEHFHADKAEIYWADENLALVSASNGVRGGRPEEMSFGEAKAAFSSELLWWAKFADTH